MLFLLALASNSCFRSPHHSSHDEPRGHFDMVFKSTIGAKTSHWAHIMCDPDFRSWHSIELLEERVDSQERAARFKHMAKPMRGGICTSTWPSSFPHIDVDLDV